MGYFDKYIDSKHLIKSTFATNTILTIIGLTAFFAFYPKYEDFEDWPKAFYISILQTMLFFGLAWFYPFSPFHYMTISFIMILPTLLIPITGVYC